MTTCFRLSLRSTLDAAAAADVLISLAIKPAVGCFSWTKIETFFFHDFFCYQKNVYDAFCLYIMIYRANNNNNNALWMLAFIWYCKCLCACVCVREGVHYCVCVGWPVITISFSVYILLLSVKLQYAAYWKHTTPGQSVSERHRRGLFLLLCSSSAEIPINLLYHLIYTFVYLAVHSKYTEL